MFASILFHLLFNPFSGIGVGLLAVAAVAIWFIPGLGPAKLLKIAVDIRTWFVIALVLALLAFVHAEQRTDKLEKQIASATQQKVADTGAQQTVQLRTTQQTKRQAQATRLQASIQRAPPGQAQDAVLDAIAAEQGQHVEAAPVDPPAPVAPPPVSPPQPAQVPHASVQPPVVPPLPAAAAPGPQPPAGSLRKPIDGTLVP